MMKEKDLKLEKVLGIGLGALTLVKLDKGGFTFEYYLKR
jgi:hypothetical protein